MNSPLAELLADEQLLTLAQAGDLMAIPATKVSDLLDDRKLAAVKVDRKLHIPASLFEDDGSINRFASSTITVLSDGGYRDEEILTFLFTEDESLPGRPIDALHGHGAREVVRRAQAMAF